MGKPNRSPGINENMHALLTAAVGCYLFVIAYNVFTGGKADGISSALTVIFGVFFSLAGMGVLYIAWRIWQKSRHKTAGQPGETDEEAKAPSTDD